MNKVQSKYTAEQYYLENEMIDDLCHNDVSLTILPNAIINFSNQNHNSDNKKGRNAHTAKLNTPYGVKSINLKTFCKAFYWIDEDDLDAIEERLAAMTEEQIQTFVHDYSRSVYLLPQHYKQVNNYTKQVLSTFLDWNCILFTAEFTQKVDIRSLAPRKLGERRAILLTAIYEYIDGINAECIKRTNKVGITYLEEDNGSQFGVYEVHSWKPDIHLHNIVTCNYDVLVEAKLIKHKDKMLGMRNQRRCLFFPQVYRAIEKMIESNPDSVCAKNHIKVSFQMVYDIAGFMLVKRYLSKNSRNSVFNIYHDLPYFLTTHRVNLKDVPESRQLDGKVAYALARRMLDIKDKEQQEKNIAYNKQNPNKKQRHENPKMCRIRAYANATVTNDNDEVLCHKFNLYIQKKTRQFGENFEYTIKYMEKINDILKKYIVNDDFTPLSSILTDKELNAVQNKPYKIVYILYHKLKPKYANIEEMEDYLLSAIPQETIILWDTWDMTA